MSNIKFKIPKDNNLLKKDISKRKKEYMLHLYQCFKEIDIKKEIPKKINVFMFSGTNLEVIVKQSSFVANIQNLIDYFSSIEEYEICTVLNNKINFFKENSINED